MEQDTYRRMAEIQDRHWWYEGRRRILSALIGTMNLPQNATILEAGCGPGANLNMLSRFGVVSAFEPDDYARDYAAALSGVEVKTGFLPHDLPFTAPFDLVGAFDVIEHVEADQDSLNALFALTKTGGHAVFTVPAFQFLWSRHDDANHHKRRYTKAAFAAKLEKAGYKIEKISYYNTWLFPVIAAVRFAKNILKIEDSPDETMPSCDAINAALCAIFASERHVLKSLSFPVGVSIIAICTRPS